MNWDKLIEMLPGSTFLQTEEWAKIKAPIGWRPIFESRPRNTDSIESAGMMLIRSFHHFPFTIAYVPRGPLVDWTNPSSYQKTLFDLIQKAKDQNAIFLKIDPDLPIGRGIPGTESDRPDLTGMAVQQYLSTHGWRFSQDQIQFRNTIEIDLSPSEDQLLARMHQKTRYNIRLAEKRGVQVEKADENDWLTIYRMYAETADRDGFIIRPWEYYDRVWSILSDAHMATCLKAVMDGTIIGAIWVIGFGRKAHYLYGMSSSIHRELMPNHLLQWKGMLLAKEQGREIYDMWGAPNEFGGTDSLSGVFRFKQGFGGDVIRTLGAWDYSINYPMYKEYTSILPRVLNLLRARSRKNTRQLLDN